jgi:hypothetical protein
LLPNPPGGNFSPVITPRTTPRKRVLIVNCYADETRRAVARRGKVPQTLGPVFLAGGFHPAHWDIKIHNEHSDGPLEDPELAGWPDLLVLTGLLTSLDRMRHLTAYARTRNPRVVVVGGGHLPRALPKLCASFMDVVCQGDVEEIRDVISGLFGPAYASEEMTPRFDLGHYIGRLVGYVESTRYCNFKCSFCTLSAEGRKYDIQPVEALRKQLRAIGPKRIINFNDNNFYGNDRASFKERVACAREGWEAGHYGSWAALLTGDFFSDPRNLRLVKESGCSALFSGVESFDVNWTASQNKKQNGLRDQVGMIRECLESGVVFLYGLMLDLSTRSIAEARRELDMVVSCSDITLPAYLSLTIPIPGTPYFYEKLDAGAILPDTRIRDLDSTTITLRPVDSLAEAAAFAKDLQTMRGYRGRILRHAGRFAWKYRHHLNADQMILSLLNGLFLAAPLSATLPGRVGGRAAPRTYVSTTEPLDLVYRPAFPVATRYQHLFEPVRVTDPLGRLADEIAEDVGNARPAPVRIAAASKR